MKKVIDIINMKQETVLPFKSSYHYFFEDLINNYITRADGLERNRDFLKVFDKEAQEYVIHQVFLLNEELAKDLIDMFKIEEPFISNENLKELLKKEEFNENPMDLIERLTNQLTSEK